MFIPDQKKIEEIYANRAEVRRLEARNKELMEELQGLEVGQSLAVGPFRISALPNRRFDANLAESILTKGQFMKASKRVAQSALVKSMYPELYEGCQKESPTPRIDISIPTE